MLALDVAFVARVRISSKVALDVVPDDNEERMFIACKEELQS
jgi:hypothetical protein